MYLSKYRPSRFLTESRGLISVSLTCIIVLFGIIDNRVLNPVNIHCIFFAFSRTPFFIQISFFILFIVSSVLISSLKLSMETECMN